MPVAAEAAAGRPMKKYVIFDFDGTLACTNDVIVASWQATFDHYLGFRPDRRMIEATFGETLKYTIETNFPNNTVEEVREYYRAYQNAHCEGMVYAFEGVRELIDELHERGCLIGIATSRTTSSLRQYMKELDLETGIDAIVAAEDVTKHKPDPEAVLVTLERLVAPEKVSEKARHEAIMIGDTKFDIGCAMNAGVDSVLVGWSHYIDEEDMRADGIEPTHRINTPAELLDLV